VACLEVTELEPNGLTEQRVTWSETTNSDFPAEARVGGQHWVVRINDWPDYPFMYTLFIDGREVLELESWPRPWTRPSAPR